MPPKAKPKNNNRSNNDAENDSVNNNKTSFSEMTVVKLKDELKKFGLDTKGIKTELVDRLEKAVASNGGSLSSGGSASTEPEKEEKEEEEVIVKVDKGKRKAVDPSPDEAEATQPTRSSKRLEKKKEDEEEQDATTGVWKQHESVLYLSPSGITHGPSVFGFDMDDTLIETRSGKTFAQGRSDWKWLFPDIPERLRELHKSGVNVVIFTNQGGIDGKNGYDKTKEAAITGKILDLQKELDIPLEAFIATTEDGFRKPSIEMWKLMVTIRGNAPDLKQSAYIGDAAGRPNDWAPGRKKDFSCSDRKFAHNIGIAFHTPEEYFLKQAPAAFDWGAVDVNALIGSSSSTEITDGGVDSLTKTTQEMVVFVGFPASGKSTLAKTYFVPRGYVHVNRDTLKTPEKCMKAAEQAVKNGQSVVIDNTSPSQEERARYTRIAKAHNIPVRCFRFNVTLELAQHLNYYRERLTEGAVHHVPKIGYNIYKSKFQEPQLSEGFTEIRTINFVPRFNSAKEEGLFNQKA